MRVSLAESALGDLQQILSYYEEENVPEVGRQLVSAILERIEALGAHPDIGRVVPEFDSPALRELIHPPFRIVYRRQPRKVQVVRVWRSERLLALP